MGSVSLKRNLSDLYLGFIIIEAIVLRAEQGKNAKKVSTSRMQHFTSPTHMLESKLALNEPLWRRNSPYSVGTGKRLYRPDYSFTHYQQILLISNRIPQFIFQRN